jgi:hypothetical protein
VELVGGLRAGTNRRAALKTEEANDLHRTVLRLGCAHRIPGERGSRRCFCISRIGLSVATPNLAIRAVDLDDLDVVLAQVPGEAGAVRAGPLDTDAIDGAKFAQP